jgi:hypothetical protein
MGRKASNKKVPVEPTREQMRDGAFALSDIVDRSPNGRMIEIGTAYRRRPQIDILAAQGLLNSDELKALHHYRHHADLIERSPVRDSLCLMRGHGNGPTITTLNAAFIVREIEAAVGSLVDILRAVVVDDVSLSQWAIRRAGALEVRRQRQGRVVTQLEPRQRALAIAKLEMKIVAQRVASELAS